MHRLVRMAPAILSIVLLPAAAFGQASIAGFVKDTSGAVLPGVSVEAASPALTERVRTVVTDGTGQYRVVDLPPGNYTVTFTLPGFSVVRREGIGLAGTFTATVNADLRVGGIAETVTVTGESPIVDVQSARRQQVIDAQASIGGPIRKDRLWYYFNWREVGSADAVAGVFANKNAGDPARWTYEPDYGRQARNDVSRRIAALRTTIQGTPRNKFDVYFDNQPFCNGSGWTPQDEACRTSKNDEWIQGGSTGTTPSVGPGPSSPETGDYNNNGTLIRQLTWQSPMTSR